MDSDQITIEVIQAGDGGDCATCGYANKRCAVLETHGVTFSICDECLDQVKSLLDFDTRNRTRNTRVDANSGGESG